VPALHALILIPADPHAVHVLEEHLADVQREKPAHPERHSQSGGAEGGAVAHNAQLELEDRNALRESQGRAHEQQEIQARTVSPLLARDAPQYVKPCPDVCDELRVHLSGIDTAVSNLLVRAAVRHSQATRPDLHHLVHELPKHKGVQYIHTAGEGTRPPALWGMRPPGVRVVRSLTYSRCLCTGGSKTSCGGSRSVSGGVCFCGAKSVLRIAQQPAQTDRSHAVLDRRRVVGADIAEEVQYGEVRVFPVLAQEAVGDVGPIFAADK